MKVHAVCTHRQYARHLSAIWRCLPDDLRGEFRDDPRATGKGLPADDVVMVASTRDIVGVRQRIVFVEHGADQAYWGDVEPGGSPAGGSIREHPERIIGYICPRREVLAAWGGVGVVAGCPALDFHDRIHTRPRAACAAITFHWDAALCPESRSARPHYLRSLATTINALRHQGFHVLGHRHGRDSGARQVWAGHNVEFCDDPDEVLARATLLIADNTSLMYEAAALDRPVLALNTPIYRRHVEHGLRFWSHIPGWQINDSCELASFDFAGYVADDPSAEMRRAAAAYTYEVPVGSGGRIAADWIVSQL